MVSARHCRLLPENDLEILERRGILVESAPACRSSGPVSTPFGEGKINEAILLELRVQHHIEQTTLPLCNDFRRAPDRIRNLSFQAYPAKGSAALRHQHGAVGQECGAPGAGESVGDCLYA